MQVTDVTIRVVIGRLGGPGGGAKSTIENVLWLSNEGWI